MITRDEFKAIIQQENWWKLFRKRAIEQTSEKTFNRHLNEDAICDWIWITMIWDNTPEGRQYWDDIHSYWIQRMEKAHLSQMTRDAL